MGDMLEQEQEYGVYKSVLYRSSVFRKYEQNYAIGEKESLPCVTSIQKPRTYLLGRKFLLRTDHRSLETLLPQDNCRETEVGLNAGGNGYRAMTMKLNTLREGIMRLQIGYQDPHCIVTTRKHHWSKNSWLLKLIVGLIKKLSDTGINSKTCPE